MANKVVAIMTGDRKAVMGAKADKEATPERDEVTLKAGDETEALLETGVDKDHEVILAHLVTIVGLGDKSQLIDGTVKVWTDV